MKCKKDNLIIDMHNFTLQSLIQMDLHFENENLKTTMLYITKPMQYIQT